MRIESEINSRQTEIESYTYNNALVLGVGGIGSWVALNLALSGKIERMVIVDPDIVESSNLNRTPFRICDISYPKVDAMKYLILERRIMNVLTYKEKTSDSLRKKILADLQISFIKNISVGEIINNNVIIDCRDDVYEDFYSLPYKYYKIGYDGLSITIDGNPRNTPVWGRADGYRFTPSFVCPAQLAANIVVTDILTVKLTDEQYDNTANQNPFDIRGRINKAFTFDCKDVMEILYRESLINEGN